MDTHVNLTAARGLYGNRSACTAFLQSKQTVSFPNVKSQAVFWYAILKEYITAKAFAKAVGEGGRIDEPWHDATRFWLRENIKWLIEDYLFDKFGPGVGVEFLQYNEAREDPSAKDIERTQSTNVEPMILPAEVAVPTQFGTRFLCWLAATPFGQHLLSTDFDLSKSAVTRSPLARNKMPVQMAAQNEWSAGLERYGIEAYDCCAVFGYIFTPGRSRMLDESKSDILASIMRDT